MVSAIRREKCYIGNMDNQKDDFRQWVIEEYQARGWSMRELARRMELSHTAISLTLSGQNKVTYDFAASLADAFSMSKVGMFRRAGLLPKRNNIVEEIAEAVELLDGFDQTQMLHIALALAHYRNVDPNFTLRRMSEYSEDLVDNGTPDREPAPGEEPPERSNSAIDDDEATALADAVSTRILVQQLAERLGVTAEQIEALAPQADAAVEDSNGVQS